MIYTMMNEQVRAFEIIVFHVGSYQKETEDIWDKVLREIEKRYDLSNTKLYLHGVSVDRTGRK